MLLAIFLPCGTKGLKHCVARNPSVKHIAALLRMLIMQYLALPRPVCLALLLFFSHQCSSNHHCGVARDTNFPESGLPL